MEDSLDDAKQELIELQKREAQLDQKLAEGCELLLYEFRQRFPPLIQIPELTLRPETLRKWLAKQKENRL